MFVPTSEWPLTYSDIQCSVCRRWCHDTGELVEHERVHIPAEREMRCPGCDCNPVGYAPHNGKGDCPPKSDVSDGSPT